jgi:hypothetical protein
MLPFSSWYRPLYSILSSDADGRPRVAALRKYLVLRVSAPLASNPWRRSGAEGARATPGESCLEHPLSSCAASGGLSHSALSLLPVLHGRSGRQGSQPSDGISRCQMAQQLVLHFAVGQIFAPVSSNRRQAGYWEVGSLSTRPDYAWTSWEPSNKVPSEM